ncbi:MAG: peptidoglycan bridge formation glycyltransferase FemA/FemB family protein [Chloroflexota bacterium]|nr:peptidoglycan bridge formation glycyltransferase FemA/FemB family protein [Chloroflexota bacterium]
MTGVDARADRNPPPAGERAPEALEQNSEAWDEFVAASPQPTHLQTTAWAEIKRANGWRPLRLAGQAGRSVVGAQLLVRRAAGVPWGLGYVPRGPVGDAVNVEALARFTDRARDAAPGARLAWVRIEPELEVGAGHEQTLARLGWRRAPHVQPESTRIIDLKRPLDEVWNDLHRKCRQSVNKARRLGIRVVDADGDRLSDFYRIHTSAAGRAGIIPRTESTYRQMWQALAPRGMARLLFAEREETGEAVATLFLVSCGQRVVDLYGGTTAEGDSTRANYVLKWEAIERCREWGFAEYDLWGLPRAGIAQFKASFGGREVHYVGAWDLTTDRIGRAVLQAGLATRATYLRFRYGRRSGGEEGD